MTEIILARHGETEWNVAEVFRGRIDVELNDTSFLKPPQKAQLSDFQPSIKEVDR